MPNVYKTPGVYIEEITKFPPSVAAVETAIPAFIGYTQVTTDSKGDPIKHRPIRITSMLEYELNFGKAQKEKGSIAVFINVPTGTGDAPSVRGVKIDQTKVSPFKMYYALQFYFANGGGPCYIVSAGGYDGGVLLGDMQKGLDALEKVDEVTLLVFPDGNALSAIDYYNLQKASLDQCVKLQDRFAVMDVWRNDVDEFKGARTPPASPAAGGALGPDINVLKYGAIYYPSLETILDYEFDDGDVSISPNSLGATLNDIKAKNNALYFAIKAKILEEPVVLSAAAGVVGIYADVDSNRGVWKAPANVNMDYVIKPTIAITDAEQKDLNVDTTGGKSINAIRSFTGRGQAIIWGARTLAGNDNEWRYIPVRRFFNMVEESVKKATAQFVFEPNDANTWVRVRAMIENFLILQWRAGALQGSKPEQSFYVKVGLGETMTALDILEGRMIVEIGMAAVRPAEFIILRFSHKMAEA